MSRREAMQLHADRAFQELDCARRAETTEAAIAHLALSELHLGRMRDIGDAPRGARLELVRP
jgi:hypothetical protein